jgi:four helix bundle protein
MQDFRNLRTWRLALQFEIDVYWATRSFPTEQRYILTSQLLRSANAIGANIAEGCGYNGNRDSARFYEHSLGSASESLHHLIVSNELRFLDTDRFQRLSSDLGPIRGGLAALIRCART